MGQVLVAICTYDRHALLARALTALLAQPAPGVAWRVLVVDNSPDQARAAEEAKRWAADPRVDYRLEPQPGIANARNVALRAAEAAGAEFLVFLDDDAVPRPGWLPALLQACADAKAGAVGGKVELEWPQPRPAWLHDLALPYLSQIDWGPVRREVADGEWLACANLAFRVAALAAVGGFKTALGRYGGGAMLLSNEEGEVLRRLRRAGWRVLYEPAAVVDHLAHADRLTQAWFRRRAAWQAVSDFLAYPAIVEQRARGWREIRHFTSALPWWRRGLPSLQRDIADPRLFMKQLHAIYLFTLKQLATQTGDLGDDQDA